MGTGTAALLGRSEELARLRAAAKTAASRGTLVLLEGEAGAGKTRLLEEIAPTAAAAALEYAGAPYAPIRDLLAALDARRPRILKNETALAQGLRPILDLQPGGGQRQVLDAVVRALSLYAHNEPLILALEDLHWIDSASAGVLVHVARSVHSMPVLLVATYRGGQAAREHEARSLIAQLARIACETIALPPLSEGASMLLVSQIHPEPLALEVRRTICDLAQGNPLLLTELARHAASGPHVLMTSLPVSLQALVHERLARFDPTERNVLRVCAAMELFDHAIVSDVAGISEGAVLEVLRKARDAGIVSERGPRFFFAHALIRRAITGDMLALELAALHSEIARRLERTNASQEVRTRLAYHYWMAGEAEACEKYNLLAAQSAFAVYAFDDASLMLERAIGGRDIGEPTLALYEQLAQAYEHAGRFNLTLALRRRIVEYARSNRPPVESAALSIALSRSYFQVLDDDGSIAAVREGLAAAGTDADRALRFELHGLLAWYLVHLRRIGEARDALEQAGALLDAGAGIPLVRYHEARAAFEVHANGGADWKMHTERAIELSASLEPPLALSRYSNGMALACASEIDDYAYASLLLRRMEPLLASIGEQSVIPFMHMRARLLYVCGRLPEARVAVETMLPYFNDGATHAFRAASVGIPLALRTGDEALLAACARPRLLEEAFASKDPVVFGPVACGVGEHMLAQGRAGEAVALVERTLSRLQSAGNNFDLLLLAARIGPEHIVRSAIALLEPWTSRSRSAQAVMALVKAYGASGKSRAAFALAACDLFASLPWPLHLAQALELAGEAAQAQALYAECGADAEAARILRTAKREPGATILSKRESEVAVLVAEGKSNRLIAETLVLSERTVENHIASIFTKLGMRSRAEIASFVARENAKAV